jgi:hypothetical protein
LSNVSVLLYIKLLESFSDTLQRPYSGNFDSENAYRNPPVIVKKLYQKAVRKILPIATASNEGRTLHIDQSQKARLDESVN